MNNYHERLASWKKTQAETRTKYYNLLSRVREEHRKISKVNNKRGKKMFGDNPGYRGLSWDESNRARISAIKEFAPLMFLQWDLEYCKNDLRRLAKMREALKDEAKKFSKK